MSKSTPLHLTISIVIYELNLTLLTQTLTYLAKACAELSKPVQLWIIDNYAGDKNQAALAKLITQYSELNPLLHHTQKNIGYGAGNNTAIRASTTPYHLVLNPDLLIKKPSLVYALDYLDQHPDVGLVCPAISGTDGVRHYAHRKDPTLLDLSIRVFPWIERRCQKRVAKFELRQMNYTIPQAIESPSGCCMLFRTKIVQAIQGFDEKFFLHYEDCDIGRRLRKKATIVYLPNFKVIHIWTRASKRSWKMKFQVIRSGLRYLHKWGWPLW